MKAYLISGPSHIQSMFRAAPSTASSDVFFLMVQKHIWNATKEDLAKFANDKSGRQKFPLGAPSHGEDAPDVKTRYWAGMHAAVHRYLSQTDEANALARSYQRFFTQTAMASF